MMTRINFIALATALIGAWAIGGNAVAARKVCDDGSFPPCNKPPVGEAASNNLSFPVIWSDGERKPGFVQSDDPWSFATVEFDGEAY